MLTDTLALIGAMLWGGAAIVTGVPRGLVPSEIPFLFTVPAIIGGLLGLTGWTRSTTDEWLILLAISIYVLAPVVLAAWILHARSAEQRDNGNPKTIT